ncbi:MAG: peptide-methionine (S)-S-oxide reductase MsrA [Solirubrobacterales bacterium]|nr:peptide-methionine (S)-S-oxide reductase MsrA [Solirubrobacterales bacterium]MCB8971905.1 peptide-methionine (S)-S-oxide reductase MsrA [Thermoleophilales bacterium]MCO5326291.1 peptide-methionine (S)-S-oxide reductase MsrA [Solirubrobacterales bacterium]
MTETETDGAPFDGETEVATFGAGCFWKPEAEYRKVEGVVDTAVGYEGGHVPNPTYEQVCTGATGHAEVVRVTFDPKRISYDEILDRFWDMHDPTQVNRQGPDIGDQYRTVIFTHTPAQEAAAQASRERHQADYSEPIATSIEPATGFYMAEDYHQCYLEQRQSGGLLRQLLGH